MTNLKVNGVFSDAMFELSNTGHWHLGGFIEGHPTIPDGHLTKTSRVLEILPSSPEEGDDYIYIRTKNNLYAVETKTLHASITEIAIIIESL